MSLRTDNPPLRSAAWRISLGATLAFACGTIVVFIFLQRFMAGDIQRRSDAWLSGEVEVLGDVAERTPKDALYDRVVGEVAELAAREVPNKLPNESGADDAVFFLQSGSDGSLKLWVGAGNGEAHLKAINAIRISKDHPTDLDVPGFAVPFRVASTRIDDGSYIFLGLSERDELRVLANLRLRFFLLYILIVLLGFGIVFLTTRRMLSHVRRITEAASRIGHSDLDARVPTTRRNDEISQLALTLNRMLDRIESSIHQLHTITDSLAHDLRSPLTAIRGKLEMSLSTSTDGEQTEPIVSAIDELDRLSDFLNKSLDVAEAKADALRLARSHIDLDNMLKVMLDLYEPSLSEKGLKVSLHSGGPVNILADAALLHRMIANLLDNELKHLPAACALTIELRSEEDAAWLIFEDDGPGFEPEVLLNVFERRVKGRDSNGHGLGLAFVDAVTHAHRGTVTASNRETGGARITITLPLASQECAHSPASAMSSSK
ncbi:MAG: HAMP domain-containing sensor histidine kinase [Terracidiphilus sp.]|jgi:signal transduction histidine kinase